jgi:proteasome accessory factor B
MSSRRTERLLNLVICLLATRRWLTKEQIRAAVPQYAGCESAEAFDRMFERDKEDLRELGIPLVTGSDSAWFDDEVGYRVDGDAYPLPEVHFTAEELAVLGLASRLWQQANLAGPAARALVKLRALGVETDQDSLTGLEPRIRTTEPSFSPLYAATRDRAPVAFRYRKPSGELSERHVEPWTVTGRGSHWYLVGHDRDRGAARVFRLSRVVGTVRRIGPAGSYRVPEDLNAQALVGMPHPEDDRTAVLRVRPGRGGMLRRRSRAAEQTDPGDQHLTAPDRAPQGVQGPQEHSTPGRGSADWDLLWIRVGDITALADEISGYGPDVVALEPPDLREAVHRRLQATLTAHLEPEAGPGRTATAEGVPTQGTAAGTEVRP